ncbi:LacI family transcriptional regulator [Nakamurella sp. UYEF19]|uniref:LacI family DNA-binding transcriptional regulator n=1 Tax=Nakamurella sp. UYEF19 TaxID=1756392 RepID=UPI003393AF09
MMTGSSPRQTRPTLATVAASAGVSVATVSKVLNGRSDVAAATRIIVQEVLQQHDYVRSTPPRLDIGAHPTVEVEVDGALRAYSSEVVQGVIDAGAQAGVSVVVSTRVGGSGNRPAERPTVWARALAASGRRGVVAVTSVLTAEHLTALSRAKIPLVLVDPMNMPRARVTSVGSTNFAGGLTATQHLLSLGHRRIGYIGDKETAACNQARVHGFRAAMEGAGAPILPGYIGNGLFDYDTGVTRGAAMLDLLEPPTAIFAGCDEIALGVIEAARIRGLSVPRDISVVGFDDTQLARMSSPGLTTVRQPLREMGGVALRTVLRLAAGETVESHHVELATGLIVRDSTAPVHT